MSDESDVPAARRAFPRVLIVDDLARVRRAVARLVARHGTVTVAASAAEAREQLSLTIVDVVLTDYEMPGENGIALLDHVRAEYPRTRRLLMSGSAPAELERHVASGLVERFLEKPLDLEALIAWLREVG